MYANIFINDFIVTTDMDEGEIVCLNVVSGNYFGINEVAKDIWSLLIDVHSEDEIVAQLMKIYDVDQNELKNDVRAYLEELKENGLVTYDEQ